MKGTGRRPWVLAALVTVVLCLGGLAPAPAGARTAHARPAAMTQMTLILDFIPNAVHAGIYHAVAAGYYRQQHIDLTIIQPTSTSDTLKLIAAGKAEVGIADGIDVANQIDQGRDAQAILALVQRPLNGLITLAKAGITNPKQLEGKTIGITGVPSDTALARTVITHAGGDYSKVQVVTIGFNGVQDLESGKIAAFTGFWPADGVQVQVDGYPVRSFKFDDYGGPRYPGLVIFSTRARVASDAGLLRAFLAATVHGYQDTLRSPMQSLADLLKLNPALKRPITLAQLKAYMPLFQGSAKQYGLLNTQNLRNLSAFLVKSGLIKAPISPDRYGTNKLLP